jgi:hypothetical protein
VEEVFQVEHDLLNIAENHPDRQMIKRVGILLATYCIPTVYKYLFSSMPSEQLCPSLIISP